MAAPAAQSAQAQSQLEQLRAEHVSTLSELDDTVEENQRLLEKIRILEAQIIPAEPHPSESKIVAPSCAEFHTIEREANEKLRDEIKQLQGQLKRTVHTVTLLEQQLVTAGQQIRRSEVEKDMSVSEVKEQLLRTHRSEIALLQEQIAETERRFSAERKRLLEERDQLSLRLGAKPAGLQSSLAASGPATITALAIPLRETLFDPSPRPPAPGEPSLSIGEQVTLESLRKLVVQLAEENAQLRGLVSRNGSSHGEERSSRVGSGGPKRHDSTGGAPKVRISLEPSDLSRGSPRSGKSPSDGGASPGKGSARQSSQPRKPESPKVH